MTLGRDLRHDMPRKVVQLNKITKENIKVWPSIAEASKELNIPASSISFCCSGKRKSAGGHSFCFSDKITPEEETKEFSCKICKNNTIKSARALASHVFIHGISTEEYTEKYILDNEKPKCVRDDCSNKPRYSNFKFSKYCSEHFGEACREGGRVGGTIKETRNKGKTKRDDNRLMNQSIIVSGPSNHFFSREHSKESKELIADSRRLSEDVWNTRIKSRENEFKVLSPTYENYSKKTQKLLLECLRCGTLQKKTLIAFERGSLCVKCFPFEVAKENGVYKVFGCGNSLFIKITNS
jgi:hypothetical protein